MKNIFKNYYMGYIKTYLVMLNKTYKELQKKYVSL